MSVHISSDVWKYSRARGAALTVIVSLADQANDAGECHPSVESIAARCRVSVRSVHRYLDQLCALGELHRTERPGRSSVYVVTPLGRPTADTTPANLADLPTADETPANLAEGYANLADPSANLTEASANLADPSSGLPLPPVAEGSATVGRQNRHLTVRTEEPSSSPIADAIPDKDTPGAREDVDELCEHLSARLKANGVKRHEIKKDWRTAARLLLDRDGWPADKAHKLIDWCQDDPFWRSNILSMPTFRAQYDQLRLKAIEDWERKRQPGQRPQPVPAYVETPALPPEDLPWRQQPQAAAS